MAATKVAGPAWRIALSRWAYNKSYFPQLGLLKDDTLMLTPEVQEAVNRLPKKLQDERVFRLSRAARLSTGKIVLPKEEWTKFEDDTGYLQPYLEEVRRENEEKREWDKQ